MSSIADSIINGTYGKNSSKKSSVADMIIDGSYSERVRKQREEEEEKRRAERERQKKINEAKTTANVLPKANSNFSNLEDLQKEYDKLSLTEQAEIAKQIKQDKLSLKEQIENAEELNKTVNNPQENERTWLQKGAFEDGYQAFDTARAIFGTASDIGQDFTKGVLGIGEGIQDAGAYIIGLNAKHASKTLGKVADLFDKLDVPENKIRDFRDKAAQIPDSMQAFIERDLVEESKLANIGSNTGVSGVILNTLNGEIEKS